MIKPSDRISTKDAAAMLDMPHSTFKGWVARGLVTVERVGRDNFVSKRQIQKFVDQPETRPVRAYTWHDESKAA